MVGLRVTYQMINCKFVSVDYSTAVPVHHNVPSLPVRDVHGRGTAEESSYMLERSQAYIFTPDEGVLK
jgi:hypothetical protein